MAHMKQKVSVTLKLPQLQNLIKRDPPSYKDEFMMQKRHFDSELDIFKLRPTKESERFMELVTFMSHVAVCYKEECESLAPSIMELLETHATILHTDVRAKLLQACILLRNKGMIDPLNLIRLAFKLFSVNDKALRSSLVEYIFNDIKTINHQKQNDKLNRSIQAFLFSIVEDDTTVTARKTVDILCELYRRKVWTDARTVNMLGKACLSKSTRVSIAAINFFLGIESKMHEDEEEEKTAEKGPAEVDYHAHSKKTKKRQRQTQKQVERNAKLRRESQKGSEIAQPLFPAIQLLHDPQSLAEKLFKKLRQSGERFEVKLLMMNFSSRLIGCHKLLLLSFYSYLQRYLTSHQQDVTNILAYLIQACHELVPPEDLVPVVKAIAHNFITERCTNEAITVGINTVREIIVRAPSLLREPGMDDFVQDLVMYGKKAHKSVMIAAHGMVNLVRELYPALLKRGDRGKFHNPNAQPVGYGQQRVADGVEGAELLEAYENGEIEINSDDEVVWHDEDGEEGDSEEEEEEEEDEDEGEEGSEGEEGGSDVASEDGSDDDEEEEEEEDEGEDGESEGEWVSVSDDDSNGEGSGSEDSDEEGSEIEDDDEEQNPRSNKRQKVEPIALSAQQQVKKMNNIRGRVDARRVLTEADFALLEKLKAAQAERALDPRSRRKSALLDSSSALKRKREEEDVEEGAHAATAEYAVDASALAPGIRSEKSSKIERIMHVLDGRKDAKKFEHEGHAGGLTNKEKLRKKNFVMVRKGKRAVTGKLRQSNGQARHAKRKGKEILGRDKRKRRRT